MARSSAEEKGRAERPRKIPKAGWRDILLRTWTEMSRDHVSMISAGVAFYGLLALFSAIAAWGLMFDPAQIEQQIEQVSDALPQQAAAIIEEQARKLAASAGTGIGIAAVGGLLLTLRLEQAAAWLRLTHISVPVRRCSAKRGRPPSTLPPRARPTGSGLGLPVTGPWRARPSGAT